MNRKTGNLSFLPFFCVRHIFQSTGSYQLIQKGSPSVRLARFTQLRAHSKLSADANATLRVSRTQCTLLPVGGMYRVRKPCSARRLAALHSTLTFVDMGLKTITGFSPFCTNLRHGCEISNTFRNKQSAGPLGIGRFVMHRADNRQFVRRLVQKIQTR